jgi:hypothetical protein
LKVAAGKKQVKIEGFKVVGQQHLDPLNPKTPMVDVTEPIISERYNAKTELTREISSAGACDFNLE